MLGKFPVKRDSVKKMFTFKKNTMSLWEMLRIIVVIFSSFNPCVKCALVITPQNVAVLSGEVATLHCASNVSRGNLAWSTLNPGSSDRDFIYIKKKLASSVSSYISVYDEEDGKCSLQINASVTAAKRYICVEHNSGDEASAELIVFKSPAECNLQVIRESVEMKCSVMFAGNWAPELVCESWTTGGGFALLDGTKVIDINNNVVTSTRIYMYTNKNILGNSYCSMKFDISGRPKVTTATNIPAYEETIFGFQSMETTTTSPRHEIFTKGYVGSICLNVLLLIVTIGLLILLWFWRTRKRILHNGLRESEKGIQSHDISL